MKTIEAFFNLNKETWNREIAEETNLEYLIPLEEAFDEIEGLTKGERLYYGLLISKRIVEIIGGDPRQLHLYFDF